MARALVYLAAYSVETYYIFRINVSSGRRCLLYMSQVVIAVTSMFQSHITRHRRETVFFLSISILAIGKAAACSSSSRKNCCCKVFRSSFRRDSIFSSPGFSRSAATTSRYDGYLTVHCTLSLAVLSSLTLHNSTRLTA